MLVRFVLDVNVNKIDSCLNYFLFQVEKLVHYFLSYRNNLKVSAALNTILLQQKALIIKVNFCCKVWC